MRNSPVAAVLVLDGSGGIMLYYEGAVAMSNERCTIEYIYTITKESHCGSTSNTGCSLWVCGSKNTVLIPTADYF